MAEETPTPSPAVTSEITIPTMVVGIDDSQHSFYALQWTLDHFFPVGTPAMFKLVVVHSKPPPTPVLVSAGAGGTAAIPFVEPNLEKNTAKLIEKAKRLCSAVNDVTYEVVEGDARNVLCEAVEKHQAHILVVGSHGYGVIKRAVLGSVSDYCAHHAHCSVMIVKKPKGEH